MGRGYVTHDSAVNSSSDRCEGKLRRVRGWRDGNVVFHSLWKGGEVVVVVVVVVVQWVGGCQPD